MDYISKQEFDVSIDSETTTAQCVLVSEVGECIRFTAHMGEVINIVMLAYLVDIYRSRVAENQRLADYSKSLFHEGIPASPLSLKIFANRYKPFNLKLQGVCVLRW